MSSVAPVYFGERRLRPSLSVVRVGHLLTDCCKPEIRKFIGDWAFGEGSASSQPACIWTQINHLAFKTANSVHNQLLLCVKHSGAKYLGVASGRRIELCSFGRCVRVLYCSEREQHIISKRVVSFQSGGLPTRASARACCRAAKSDKANVYLLLLNRLGLLVSELQPNSSLH